MNGKAFILKFGSCSEMTYNTYGHQRPTSEQCDILGTTHFLTFFKFVERWSALPFTPLPSHLVFRPQPCCLSDDSPKCKIKIRLEDHLSVVQAPVYCYFLAGVERHTRRLEGRASRKRPRRQPCALIQSDAGGEFLVLEIWQRALAPQAIFNLILFHRNGQILTLNILKKCAQFIYNILNFSPWKGHFLYTGGARVCIFFTHVK